MAMECFLRLFKKRKPFIVIEGIDGTGKSTVTEILAERLGIEQTQTPSGIWRKHRGLVSDASPCAKFIYYSLANLHTLFEIQKLRKKKITLCTRFVHTTKAYHIMYGCLLAKLIPLRLLSPIQPSVVYYLTVTEKERLKRIKFREGNVPMDYDSVSLRIVNDIYLSFPDMIVVDTTAKTVEEVCDIIQQDISRKFGSA